MTDMETVTADFAVWELNCAMASGPTVLIRYQKNVKPFIRLSQVGTTEATMQMVSMRSCIWLPMHGVSHNQSRLSDLCPASVTYVPPQ